jgi:hypothetical protein
MTTLRASPFNLLYNQSIKVIAQAKNTNGWGDISEANSDGARIQTEPGQMNAVTRVYDTTETILHVSWTELLGDKTGGAAIDSYHLQWDKASNELQWFDLIGQAGGFFQLEY